MKHTLIAASLLALSLHASAAVEFHTPIPASGSVSGNLDWDGADTGYARVNITNASPSRNYNGYAGQFQGYFSTDTLNETSNPANQFFRFFCIDIFEYAKDAVTQYSASRFNNDKLQKLYDIAYPNRLAGDFFDGASITSFGRFSNTRESAAFQLAIWELTNETGASHNLSNGAFTNVPISGDTLSSDAHNLANNWLTQVDNYQGAGYQNWQLYRFDNRGAQDYVSARYIPEPGSLALIGIGLLGFGLSNKRRKA